MAEEEQHFAYNCQMCIQTKPRHAKKLRLPLEQFYDPCNGPNGNLENKMVGELHSFKGYSHNVSATVVFSIYLFAKPFSKPDRASIVKALRTVFTEHAHVSQQIINDKAACTFKLLTELKDTAGKKIRRATLKHARTVDMIGRSLQKIE